MPRIDPLQLLKCLSVLLSPSGGIKSKEEVQRLASLMTKFSKKLVSKCIYIQILKTTKTDLLGMFMAAGGWTLIHTWLTDAIVAKNWPLIQELLELLLMCPVDVERLKANNCPKLVKGLSKENSNESVKLLSSKLVEQWLKIVKGETEAVRAHHLASVETKTVEVSRTESKVPEDNASASVKEEPSEQLQDSEVNEDQKTVVPQTVKQENLGQVKTENIEPKVEQNKVKIKTEERSDESESQADQLPVYKITIRDGKQVLAKVSAGEKSNRKLSADSSSSTSTIADDKTEVKPTANVTARVSDNAVKKEEIQDEIPMKPSTEFPKSSIAKTKVKTEKLENNVESTKSTKDVPKKSKDSHSSSKISDKEKKLRTESSKEKNKDLPKEKSKEKLKDKERDNRDRENNKKESDRMKEKKLSIEKNNGPSEKDKAMLAKLIPPTISKLGKIPKKPRTEETQKPVDVKKPVSNEVRRPPSTPEPSRKPSMSIECRKPNDANRPKTVKTYNSKFRSTGLEQEAKPPPARPIKKTVMPLDKKPIKLPPLKRPSPPKELLTPPEKKLKSTLADITPDEAKKNEKSGGLKLIPLRPKPPFLQESDMFMDALNASSRKEPRKRKRRISSSKDGPEAKKEPTPVKEEETNKESTPPTSPPTTSEDNKSPPIIRPLFKFYQETMGANDDDDEKDDDDDEIRDIGKKTDKEPAELALKSEEEGDQKSSTSEQDNGNENNPNNAAEESDEVTNKLVKEESPKDDSEETKDKGSLEDAPGIYPRGVLIYHKTRKGPKKVVTWKEEKDLFSIKYFELDETERVNVTKTFLDMKQMERVNEREAFMLARKLPQDDIMEEKTTWQSLIPIDLPPSLVESGVRSREKDVQYAREKVILQALYFNKTMIPDSGAEPDLEIHPTTDPVIIPLDDVTGNPDSVNDFQNTPWPEPKPILIPQSPPPQFQPPQPAFGPFPNQTFPPAPIYPNQPGMPNNMPIPGGMIVPNSMNNMNPMAGMNNIDSGNGDWRTGDGKVIPVNDMPMQMDMYNQVGPPMPMGMPGMPGMIGPGPEMNYMMGPDEMGPGGPYPPPQGFPMPGPPPPGMYPYRGGGGGGGGGGRGPNMGGGMRGGRNNQMGSRGPNSGSWYRPGGPHGWQGGSGGSGGRGNRGWGSQNRTVCKHFRGGFCRHGEKCPYVHPGVNAPPQY